MTSTYSAAYAKFNTASKAAAKFTDKKWTNSAITRERIRLLAAARAELIAAVPALAEGDATDTRAIREALAQLVPQDSLRKEIPLGDFFHAAMVVAFGLLWILDEERLER